MTSGSGTLIVGMVSSASDVFAALISSTVVYPAAMNEMYRIITPGRRDGFTIGSIRQIQFGHDYSSVATSADEEITGFDLGRFSVSSTMNPTSTPGGFVPVVFQSFDITVTVKPSSNNMNDPCEVEWAYSYTTPPNSRPSTAFLEEKMKLAFKRLDYYLRIARGARGMTRP